MPTTLDWQGQILFSPRHGPPGRGSLLACATHIRLPDGSVKAVMHDGSMETLDDSWHPLFLGPAEAEPPSIGFDSMVELLSAFLEHYPRTMFPGPGVDPGSRFVAQLHDAIEELDRARRENT